MWHACVVVHVRQQQRSPHLGDSVPDTEPGMVEVFLKRGQVLVIKCHRLIF